MSKEQLRAEIEKMRAELDSRIKSREDLSCCQALSEELDQLIAEYMEM